MGVKAMVIGQVVCAPIYYAVNAYMPGRMYGYHLFKQLRDILPFAVATVVLYFVGVFFVSFFESDYIQLIVGGGAGFASYILLCWVMKVKELDESLQVLKKLLNRHQ